MSTVSDNEFLEMMQQTPAQPRIQEAIVPNKQANEKTGPKTKSLPIPRPPDRQFSPNNPSSPSSLSTQQKQDLHALDPRPDLTKDHRLWVAVLMVANRIVGDEMDALESMGEDRQVWEGAAGVLHGMRCYEARLQRRNNGTLKLDYKPVAEHTAKERDCSVEEAERYVLETYLEPHKVQIKAIFDRTIEVARLARKGRRVG